MDPDVPGKFKSLWIDTTPDTNYPTLKKNLEVDVVVIGGGIVGLTTALFLKAEGLKVAVIERDRVSKGVTGHTTAKITSQHGIIYDYLISSFGVDKAEAYAQASEAAIDQIELITRKLKIDCDFIRKPAYVFAECPEDLDIIKKEVEAAKSLGLPASFIEDLPTPVESFGVVKFENQAQFHPRKYLLKIADTIPGEGSFIFENTTALSFKEGEPCEVETDKGEIRAKDIVVASHVPFFKNPGAFFTRLYLIRSYVYGIYIKGKIPEGMFYGTGTHTFRSQATKKGTIMLMGGEDHKAGQGGDITARYKRLAEFYKEKFEVEEIDYHWSTQDPDTPDRVPFIGLVSPDSKHVYMASGFHGWGMTNGTVAAMLISDMITGKENLWRELYDPSRVTIKASVGRFLTENVNVAKEFVKGKMQKMEEIDIEKLKKGEGRIGLVQGETLGIYKDDQGKVYAVVPECTFEGCDLVWNNAEKTWDCPCCGSRFYFDGKVMQGPATKDLEKAKL